MKRTKRRMILIAAAALAVAGTIGAIGAAGGFVVGRRWPIDRIERLRRSMGFDGPSAWSEFARTDLPRYESARVIVDGTLYLIGGFWTADPKATPRVEGLDLATGAWRRMKDMPVALTHANAVLVGGTVWLAGGFEGDHPGVVTSRVWRWDPGADVWTPGPPLPAPRGGGALVAVGGTLHYFGGYLPDRNTDSSDHWQLAPGGSAWQPRAPLPHPRGQISGLLLDGAIYAISGNIGHDPLPLDVGYVDRYDPLADRWDTVPPAPFPVSHTEGATFVHDGRIIIAGGRALTEGRENQDDIVSFNPSTGVWTHLGRLPERLIGAVAIPLGDSIVAGLGAVRGNDPSNPLLWRSELLHGWRPAAPLPDAIGEVAGGVIDGSLYLVGEGSDRTFRYDLARDTWDTLAAVRPATGHHHAAEVFDGRLWLFGGIGRNSAGLVQIYEPRSRQWEVGPPMPFKAGSSASALIGGRFFVAGGIVGNKTTDAAAVLDPSTMAWRSIAPMPRPRNHAASGTDGERFYVFGGRGPGSGDGNVVANGYDDVQIYDPRTDAWSVSDGSPGAPLPLPQARGGMGKAVWLDGEFWIIGGETENGPGATNDRVYARVDVYNPATNRWRTGPPMRTPRHGIFPILHDGHIVVGGGGVRSANSQTTVVEAIWPRAHP
jgi:N-acetylneuraminic acid mutarotase